MMQSKSACAAIVFMLCILFSQMAVTQNIFWGRLGEQYEHFGRVPAKDAGESSTSENLPVAAERFVRNRRFLNQLWSNIEQAGQWVGRVAGNVGREIERSVQNVGKGLEKVAKHGETNVQFQVAAF